MAHRRLRSSAAIAALLLLHGCSSDEGSAPTTQSPAAQAQSPEGAEALPAPRIRRREDTPPNPSPGELVQVREFYESGQLYTERTERALENHKRIRVGPMRAWWENGELRIEGGYDDQGRLTGVWRYYFETGGVEREGEFDTGKHSGVWRENWPNGKLRSEGFYHVGLREGFWRTWRDNGQPESEGEYSNNQRAGPWKFFREDGQLDADLSGDYSGNEKDS